MNEQKKHRAKIIGVIGFKRMTTKYIFVTGGVLSGVGKGITAASIGALLKARGYKVNIQKCDPYFNFDAGTLNPAEHGEVFVTKDGAETDLDLGHYERFLDIELTQSSSTMSGRIFRQVIEDERAGKYLGKTVQIIPHVTNAMQEAIADAGKGFDVHIVEVGGTVGDYESTAFIEAIRQFRHHVGAKNTLSVHVVYLPYLTASAEVKSKPAQNAVRDLREAGIQPDILIARTDHPVPNGVLNKLSLFGDVAREAVIALPTVKTVYSVPVILEEAGVGRIVAEHFGLTKKKPNLKNWHQLEQKVLSKHNKIVKIGLVAKYLDHQDTYASVIEAIKAACWSEDKKADIKWIDAESLTTKNVASKLKGLDGIVIPGGFGSRGVEGKIVAATHAFKRNIPYLGLCLGMQVACIAAARLAGLHDANSTEFDPKTTNPVIGLMEEQKTLTVIGGTMRLGNYECALEKKSKAAKLYGKTKIEERHRHRYEFSNDYEDALRSEGLTVVGRNPLTGLAEVVEASAKKYFIASQYHPEFKSRPMRPHPLFLGLIRSI